MAVNRKARATRQVSGPTLASVAEALGISRTTVSNAYSRPDQLSDHLRERILSTARDLGYPGPNPSARALSRGRTGVIGLVFPERLAFVTTDPVALSSLSGMTQACDDLGLALLLIPTTQDSGGGLDVVRNAVCDGMILYSLSDEHPLVEAAAARRNPVVSIDQPALAGGIRVGVDDAAVGRTQIEHVTGLGHRRIAVVGYRFGPDAREGFQDLNRLATSPYLMNRQRAKGFRAGLRAAGLPAGELLVYEVAGTSLDAGARAAMAVLDRHPDVTAIVADSDTLARGVVTAIQSSGRTVPQDISVIGADNNPDATSAVPALTTVDTSAWEKGNRAVAHAGRTEIGRRRQDTLKATLIIRDSTGPVA